jgi:hypothetical protein
MRLAAAAVLIVVACGKKHASPDDAARTPAPSPAPPTAPAPAPAPTPRWPELADLPANEPWRIVELPIHDPDAPDVATSGPLLIGDLAIVATSRAGFVAVDLTTATVVWSRRAGPHVAPPVARADRVILAGDCPPGAPPAPAEPSTDTIVGCFDIVDPIHVADERAGVIHGAPKAMTPFAHAEGPARATVTADGALLYRRGDQAIRVDLATGAAVPAKPADVADHLDIVYDGARWTFTLDHDTLTATAGGKPRWSTPSIDTVLAGAFNATPPRVPLVRLAGRGRPRNDATVPPQTTGARHGPGTAHDPQRPTRLLLLDVDGIDGTLGQVSHSFAGAAPVASAFGAGGATILAIRLDDTAMRHYIAAFDGNALPLWAWPLPEPPGATPRATSPQVGLAADGWVVALYDDRLAILPLVSQTPTADPSPSRIPTP